MITPSYVSVSSKHIRSAFDNGNRVRFSVASAVKLSPERPAVKRGTVTQQPLRVIANSRCKELHEMADIKFIVE